MRFTQHQQAKKHNEGSTTAAFSVTVVTLGATAAGALITVRARRLLPFEGLIGPRSNREAG